METVATRAQGPGDVPARRHVPTVMDERVRRRQAAALYLKTAAETYDPVKRSLLRRRAAELILSSRSGPGHSGS